MKFLADFHIHSRYSYATSKTMDLQELALWGQLKGLTLMGTGDFTHPLWQQELIRMLQPDGQGLFVLQEPYQTMVQSKVFNSCQAQQRFLLTAEIATIFKRNGRCYKTHSLIFAPSFDVVVKISKKLATIGNIAYDGRPILSLDIQDLLKIVLDISSDCMVIPAHIWTPHFGLLGSKSGFDSFQECFGDMIDHIYAFEKGLSSSFVMNAQCSELDRFAILANSDAHSVQNLGREANLFDTQLSYGHIIQALKNNDSQQLIAGIEFFPEMGKYYGSGHRNCNMYMTAEESLRHQICSVCKKQVTIGVAHRVAQVADRSFDQAQKHVRLCYNMVPLQKIIAYDLCMQETSKKVQKLYQFMLEHIGNEFYILLQADIDTISIYSNQRIAEYIYAIRSGNISIMPGYDGVYGEISFLK